MVADVILVTGQPYPHDAYLKLQHANEHDVFTGQMALCYAYEGLNIPTSSYKLIWHMHYYSPPHFLGLQDHKTPCISIHTMSETARSD